MLDKSKVINLIKDALKEDVGTRDITASALLPKELKIKAVISAQEEGIICGLEAAELVFSILEPSISFLPTLKDGMKVAKNQEVVYLQGPAGSILTGERTALNFLSRLSGISTLTSQYVKKTSGYFAKIFDTRKTTPNLRYLEKYAVKMGGGFNHRFGLSDQVLIKENHISAFSLQSSAFSKEKVIPQLITAARRKVQKNIKVEVEVENLEEFKQALTSKPDIIMLDNMSLEEIKEAVTFKNKSKVKVFIEASGGINLENVEKIAASGVDMISIGALTHSAKALDFSLEVIN